MTTTNSKPLNSDIVVVGRVGSPHGIKGYLKVLSFTRPAENILRYQPWLLKIRNQWQAVPVDHIEQLGQLLVARFGGIEDRDLARRYTNCEIGVSKDQLPAAKEHEYYWNDLIGLSVIDAQDQPLGTITSILETGSNDVLVIKGEKSEFAIPFIMGDVILDVDLKNKIVRVDWVE